jgi:murein DD-endopeptidase MepM/ murein hydrolase activator NlpD
MKRKRTGKEAFVLVLILALLCPVHARASAKQHVLWIQDVKWNADGSLLAISYNDFNTIEIRSASTGQAIRILKLGQYRDMAWSPDGQQIAILLGNILRVVDSNTYQVIYDSPRSDIFLGGVAWSPDGSRVAYGAGSELRIVEFPSLPGDGKELLEKLVPPGLPLSPRPPFPVNGERGSRAFSPLRAWGGAGGGVKASQMASKLKESQHYEEDSLLITPTTQGTFHLTESGLTLEIAYATVSSPAHLTIVRDDSASGARYTFAAVDSGGAALKRFEMPLIVAFDHGVSWLIGWPQTIDPAALDLILSWLIVFDAHGIYALPTSGPDPDAILYLGPLEHYTPDLLETGLTIHGDSYAESSPAERAILKTAPDGTVTVLPTAARSDRYRDRFIPEDLRNPGGFMLLGWTAADSLADIARALRGTIPNDPDLPAPGAPESPLKLILPFDCAQDWIVSWGYHHSTPQNRFAVDFAPLAPGPQPVYAAHAGIVYLKRYGTPDHLIDIGLAARVVAADGITSTAYGHLDSANTLALWHLDAERLPDFEWVEVGRAVQGEMIGVMGRTGYATGPHIHFVLWAWDQSLYQPVPLGPLTQFARGLAIPGAKRGDCDLYHR